MLFFICLWKIFLKVVRPGISNSMNILKHTMGINNNIAYILLTSLIYFWYWILHSGYTYILLFSSATKYMTGRKTAYYGRRRYKIRNHAAVSKLFQAIIIKK